MLFFEENIVYCQCHCVSDGNEGPFSTPTCRNFTVFGIVITVFVPNGSSRAFHKHSPYELVSFPYSRTFLLSCTFITPRNQASPGCKSVSSTELFHYNPCLRNDPLCTLQTNSRNFIKQFYLLGCEFCFF